MSADIKLHFEFMLYHAAMPVIGALVNYQIAENLLAGSKTAEELAKLVSISSSRLFRYLRLASYFEVFAYDKDSNKWSNTPKSIILTTPLSRSLWEWHTSPFILENYTHINSIVASDKDPYIIKNQLPDFEILFNRPDLLCKFQRAMSELTTSNLNEVIENIDIEESKKVLDVGGGDGSLLIKLIQKFPHFDGGILDMPPVGPIAHKKLSENGLSEKVQFHEGNFFESINEGYDCIMMKQIIHDWNDEKASLILKNCRKVLQEGNKLFVIDQIIDKDSEFYAINLAMDNLMCIGLGSKERTTQEFEKLFNESGFKLKSIKKAGFQSVIEALAI